MIILIKCFYFPLIYYIIKSLLFDHSTFEHVIFDQINRVIHPITLRPGDRAINKM